MSAYVTPGFEAALRSGATTPLIRIQILVDGRVEADTKVLNLAKDLRIEGGSVDQTARADIRRAFSLAAGDVDGSLLPLAAGDLLDPITGNEVRIMRGLLLDDGTEELVTVFTGGIQTAVVTDEAGAWRLELTGYDRAKRIIDNPWRTPFEVDEATNIGTLLASLIADRLTGIGTVVPNFEPTDEVTGDYLALGGDGTSNPMADGINLAAGIGMELYFDPDGIPILRTVPDPAAPGAVAFTFDDDSGDSPLLDPLVRSADRDTLRNGYIVESEAPWLEFPLRAEVWDDDEMSPTRRSLIGEHPEINRDPTVWTQDQADAAALAGFNATKGIEEQITWNSLVHPGLHESDVIAIRADSLGPAAARLSIQTLSCPVAVNASMGGTSRRRRS